ncbi:asparaginase [Ideonella livida]|uniref:Asparaginase n=1 Tax=Ideonella livida TaxID=2707176 RepID=A0A7C9PEF8_9BURK|nr:asparaginase [Ideonella livida]NDY89589.1 asparaginase [Ideonella livida]
MQKNSGQVVILGTGGTMAGRSAVAGDNVGYTAGQVGVQDLVAAVPGLAGRDLQAEQVAQLDSKDMDHATWGALARRVAYHLARPEVAGVVVTHGTDTLEETAWFLHRVLAPGKPVVLTAAMRPATALLADGPQNLLDAVTLAAWPGARGVMAVMAGVVHGALGVRKLQPYRMDAFGSGDQPWWARVEEGQVLPLAGWPPAGAALGLDCLPVDTSTWPEVVVLPSHAGCSAAWAAALEAALTAADVRGVVIEGTGNGTVHQVLEDLGRRLLGRGLGVLRASRCQGGSVVGEPASALPSAGPLTPAKARVELLLRALARGG